MGKIYCTECGTELDDSMKFCSKCGTPLNVKEIQPDSNTVKNDNNTSDKGINLNEISKKANKSKITAPKLFFGLSAGIAAVIIICVIIVIAYMGFSMMTSNVNENTTENLSPSFTDTIDGITFNIPEGYQAMGGRDNVKKPGYHESYRNYHSKENGGMYIRVDTPDDYQYFDLNQDRHTSYVDITVNGHEGIYSPTFREFKYIDNGKLVIIEEVDQNQLENIIT